MKKRLHSIWLSLAALLIILALTACGLAATNVGDRDTDEAHSTKQVVVIYSKNNVLIARGNLSNTDIYSLSLSDITDDSTPEVGDVLEVEYSGILESYPSQFGTIYSLTLVETGDATTEAGVVLAIDNDGIMTVEFVSEDGVTSQQSLSMEYDSANWFDEASPAVGATVLVTCSDDVIYCITVVE